MPTLQITVFIHMHDEAKWISFTHSNFSLLNDLVHNSDKLISEKHFLIKTLNSSCENGLFDLSMC